MMKAQGKRFLNAPKHPVQTALLPLEQSRQGAPQGACAHLHFVLLATLAPGCTALMRDADGLLLHCQRLIRDHETRTL